MTPFIHLDPLSSSVHSLSFSSLNVDFSFYRVLLYLATLLLLSTSDSCLHFALFLSSSLLNFISGHVSALLAILRRVKDFISHDVYVSALPTALFEWEVYKKVNNGLTLH